MGCWAEAANGTNCSWPYTMDSGSPDADTIFTKWSGRNVVQVGPHPGLWEMPVAVVFVPDDSLATQYSFPVGLRDRVQALLGSAPNPNFFERATGKMVGMDITMLLDGQMTRAEALATLKYTLDLRLAGNRAPMIFVAHTHVYASNWDTNAPGVESTTDRRSILEDFITYALSKSQSSYAPRRRRPRLDEESRADWRVHAHDVRGAGEVVRKRLGRLWRHALVRSLRRRPVVLFLQRVSDLRADDVRRPGQGLREHHGRMRQHALLRRVPLRSGVLERRRLPDSDNVRVERRQLHAWQMQRDRRVRHRVVPVYLASGQRQRRAVRLRYPGRLLQLDRSRQPDMGNDGVAARPKLRCELHADDVCGAWEDVRRDRGGRLRRDARVRHLSNWAVLHERERVRGELHVDDVRGAREDVRHDCGRLRRDPHVRYLSVRPDLLEQQRVSGDEWLRPLRRELLARKVRRDGGVQRRPLQVHLAGGRRERRSGRLRSAGGLLQLDPARQRGVGERRVADGAELLVTSGGAARARWTRNRPARRAHSNRPAFLKLRGAGEGIRTLDVHLGKVALYH